MSFFFVLIFMPIFNFRKRRLFSRFKREKQLAKAFNFSVVGFEIFEFEISRDLIRTESFQLLRKRLHFEKNDRCSFLKQLEISAN